MDLFGSKYNGVIVDVWGVIHNGEEALPGAQDFLDMLCDKKYPHVLLTNSPRRSSFIENVFKNFDLKLSEKTKIISCGEIIYNDLKDNVLNKYRKNINGKLKLFEIDNDKTDFFQGLENVELTKNIIESDLVFFESLDEDMIDDVYKKLEIARDNNIPILCANPDDSVYLGSNKIIRPGELLKDYKGHVIHYGKPHGRIYAEAFRHLNDCGENILSIGDNLLTDGRAASNYGMDFYLINSELAKSMNKGASNSNVSAKKTYDSLKCLCVS